MMSVNNNNKKLLILAKNQFGYHTGVFKMCKYLKHDYDITYYCFDFGLDRYEMDGVEIIYIKNEGNKLKRIYDLFSGTKQLKGAGWDIIFVLEFELCFLMKFLVKGKKHILDIRSAGIKTNFFKRKYTDLRIIWNTMFFKNISVISEGVAKKLFIRKYLVLPLGADIISNNEKIFSKLKLLYVGTLRGRNIFQTVLGLKDYIDIFGSGSDADTKLLKETILACDLEDCVKFHGRKSHSEIKEFFDESTVGVSYVPITDYYNFQPPTKTYEYLFSGMICLATDTFSNREIISDSNGVLCKDSVNSFSNGLKYIYDHREHFNSEEIRNSIIEFSWENINKKILMPYLNENL